MTQTDEQQSCGELQQHSWKATIFEAAAIRQELARAGGDAALNKTWYLLKCFGGRFMLCAQYPSLFQQPWKRSCKNSEKVPIATAERTTIFLPAVDAQQPHATGANRPFPSGSTWLHSYTQKGSIFPASQKEMTAFSVKIIIFFLL